MIFRRTITTPENTSFTNQKKTVLKLTRGILHQINIVFPPGCARLLHVHINDALHQIWPTNPDDAFADDGGTIIYKEYLEIFDEPYELQIWTWNEDDTYEHSVIIRIGILTRQQLVRQIS